MFTRAGNEPFQDTDTGEQDFTIDETCHREIKEHRQAFFTPPGTGRASAGSESVLVGRKNLDSHTVF